MIKKKHGRLIAGLGGTALLSVLALAPSAKADLEIALSEDSGPAFAVVAFNTSFTNVSFSGTFGDFTLQVFGGASDNGATLSDLLSSTTSVTNSNLLSSGTHTLHLFISQDGYSLPTGSKLNVESGLGGSVNSGTLAMNNIFQAFAANNNALFNIGDYSNALQSGTPNGSSFDTGSTTGVFTRTTATSLYSLTSEVNFTLSGGGKANFSDHENVTVAPLPATASMGLGLFGVIGAAGGLNAMRRRRLAAAL